MDELSLYFSTENDFSNCNAKNNKRKVGAPVSRPKSMYINLKSKNVHSNTEDVKKNSEDIVKPKHNHLKYRAYSSLSCSSIPSDMPHILPPEVEEGNIEYKRKLVDPTPDRFEHLVTQMKWRLNEGGGNAIYRLGVDDNGHVCGLPSCELESSLGTLERMTKRLNATMCPLRERVIVATTPNVVTCDNSPSPSVEYRKAVEFLIQQIPSTNEKIPDLSVAVVGGMDAGKSTLIGILTSGELDNGRGKARLNLFRHLHEVQSGRTSSLSSELLGFDADGHVANYVHLDGNLCRRSIIRMSSILITLLDLAGHPKYQRTTLAGICCRQPSAAILVISSTTGLSQTSIEHIQLMRILRIPMIIVLTKIDLLPSGPQRSKRIESMRMHLAVQFESVQGHSLGYYSNSGRSNNAVSPNPTELPAIFPISNVTGQGIDRLLGFLGQLGTASIAPSMSTAESTTRRCRKQLVSPFSRRLQSEATSVDDDQSSWPSPTCQISQTLVDQIRRHAEHWGHVGTDCFLFWICRVFTRIPNVPNPVLVGRAQLGQTHIGQHLWLGPNQAGKFERVEVVTLMRNRQFHQHVYTGQYVSIAINVTQKRRDSSSDAFSTANIRRGMVLVNKSLLMLTQNPQCHLDQSDSDSVLDNQSKGGDLACPIRTGVAWSVKIRIDQLLTKVNLVESDFNWRVQQVHIFAGCVYQTAVILAHYEQSTGGGESNGTNDNSAGRQQRHLILRFARNPEFVEIGRMCILTNNNNLKIVGSIVDFADPVAYECDNDGVEDVGGNQSSSPIAIPRSSQDLFWTPLAQSLNNDDATNDRYYSCSSSLSTSLMNDFRFDNYSKSIIDDGGGGGDEDDKVGANVNAGRRMSSSGLASVDELSANDEHQQTTTTI